MPKIKPAKGLEIFTDGGSRGNPGPSGVGAVLINSEGITVKEISEFIGDATNNVAEYVAVICALQEALKMKTPEITLNLDSQLVARQLKGEYKVKDRNIRKFFVIANSLIKAFKSVSIKEIPREDNKEADKLVNKALDLNTLV